MLVVLLALVFLLVICFDKSVYYWIGAFVVHFLFPSCSAHLLLSISCFKLYTQHALHTPIQSSWLLFFFLLLLLFYIYSISSLKPIQFTWSFFSHFIVRFFPPSIYLLPSSGRITRIASSPLFSFNTYSLFPFLHIFFWFASRNVKCAKFKNNKIWRFFFFFQSRNTLQFHLLLGIVFRLSNLCFSHFARHFNDFSTFFFNSTSITSVSTFFPCATRSFHAKTKPPFCFFF